MVNGFSGLILAGGEAKRMGGVPKYLLEIKGRKIIERVLDVMRLFFDEILIVANKKEPLHTYGVRVEEDIIKGQGPLGGIYTGLKLMSKEKGFFVASDMPFLKEVLVEKILQAAENSICTIPISSKGVEPLCSVYSKGMIGEIEKMLSKGDLSVRGLIQRFPCNYIRLEDDEFFSLTNINTPEELRIAN
ncbi:molybdenum cofactor guanylyltransferase [bacterium]|nr:molybdenum cofactor guanylyltransferase [bacterium]MBU1598930.1 molybdenum cofactor guanylyltransferase [bacterium]